MKTYETISVTFCHFKNSRIRGVVSAKRASIKNILLILTCFRYLVYLDVVFLQKTFKIKAPQRRVMIAPRWGVGHGH